MSWKRALDTIDARTGLYPDTGNGSLERWKGAIQRAYADFQANLPGLGPNSFASLVMASDGRSEGSRFPNLVAPKGRELYGF